MKTTIFLVIAICGTLQAQNMAFQQAGAIGVGGPMMTTSMGPMIAAGGPTPAAVAGSPFSGIETRHSLQLLGDGTRIERTETTQVARDSAGRTRTENDNTISIHDPVVGVSYLLNKKRKTATKMPALAAKGVALPTLAQPQVAMAAPVVPGPQIAVFANGDFEVTDKSISRPAEEDLGTQVVNNVPAKGNRLTITIATGEIGNDRDIHVVNERWYSDALQTVVRTSNSDPRFGTTDFELSNISQREPDASLFEVPAGYTLIEPQSLRYQEKLK